MVDYAKDPNFIGWLDARVAAYVTPLAFGAAGNSTGIAGVGTDDTVAVQAAINTGYCLLPSGKFFKVSSPIIMPAGGTLIGQNMRSSGLVGSSVAGGIIQATGGTRVTLKNFRLLGSATYAVYINGSPYLTMESVFAGADAAESALTPTWAQDGFHFDLTFNTWLSNLATSANIGGSVTFTASVGGATTGTLTAAKPNGQYNFKFSNGENRIVTITGGTTATWTVALLAGTITTAYYGSSFWFGGGCNGNVYDELATADSCAYSFYLQDDNGNGASIGNVFNAPTAQDTKQQMYIGGGYGGLTINALYGESTATGVQVGDAITGKSGDGGVVFNSPIFSAAGGIGYASPLHVSSGNSVVVNGHLGQMFYDYASLAPVTLTRGGGDTTGSGALVICIVNPAGVVVGAALARPGWAYTAAPTAAVGGAGTGAALTVQFGNVATFTGSIVGTTLTVTASDGRPIYPGITLTGGTVTAGTFIVDFISGTGGNGTYQVNTSQTKTCTGASALTGATLTANGSGYSPGYAPILLGYGAGLQINAPYVKASAALPRTPLWPLVCLDRFASGGFTGIGLTVLGDYDGYASDDGFGNNFPCAVSTNRAWAIASNSRPVLSSTYDYGRGCLVYKTYTPPLYP